MAADPRGVSTRLLREYARESGRSALVRVRTPQASWEDGVAADEPRPAASLLKVPLAMAVENAFAAGDLDPAETVAAGLLTTGAGGRRPLCALREGLLLSATDVLGLCLVLSDGACAAWLLDRVGSDAVRVVAAELGCAATVIAHDPGAPGGPLTGSTTARDALRLLEASRDESRYPLTAAALRHTVHDSRIPLGADGLDVRLAHKTGTLYGVAHDVAVIDCEGGTLSLAFLTEHQHDTLVSGYDMGICTRGLLQAWGLAVRRTRSLT